MDEEALLIERYAQFLMWRHVETPCSRCGGSGVRVYGSTSTWKGGIGGASLTSDVCDLCWGSGDANRHWTNLRLLPRVPEPKNLEEVFKNAKNEVFEDGFVSYFSVALQEHVRNGREEAVKEINDMLKSGMYNAEIIGEVLDSLVEVPTEITFDVVLEWLSHELPYVRDAASRVLMELDTERAMPYIEKAAEVETNYWLSVFMKDLIAYYKGYTENL